MRKGKSDMDRLGEQREGLKKQIELADEVVEKPFDRRRAAEEEFDRQVKAGKFDKRHRKSRKK